MLVDHDWIPAKYVKLPPEQQYLAQWALNMSIALSPLMAPGNARSGVFSPACFIHTAFSPDKPTIRGINYITAFTNFYFNASSAEDYKLR